MRIVKERDGDVTVLDIQGVIKLGESAREFSGFLEKVLVSQLFYEVFE